MPGWSRAGRSSRASVARSPQGSAVLHRPRRPSGARLRPRETFEGGGRVLGLRSVLGSFSSPYDTDVTIHTCTFFSLRRTSYRRVRHPTRHGRLSNEAWLPNARLTQASVGSRDSGRQPFTRRRVASSSAQSVPRATTQVPLTLGTGRGGAESKAGGRGRGPPAEWDRGSRGPAWGAVEARGRSMVRADWPAWWSASRGGRNDARDRRAGDAGGGRNRLGGRRGHPRSHGTARPGQQAGGARGAVCGRGPRTDRGDVGTRNGVGVLGAPRRSSPDPCAQGRPHDPWRTERALVHL